MAATRPERMLLVLDLAADVEPLARALALSAAQAAALQRRAPYRLLGVMPASEVPAELSRLGATGVLAHALPGSSVAAAAEPLVVTGGDVEAGRFTIGESRENVHIAPGDILLVLWGPIRCEPQSRPDVALRDLRRPTSRSMSDNDLFHVHTRSRLRPLEIDPQSFAFTTVPSAPESSLLRLQRGIEALAGGAAIDRSFQNEPPALGLSRRVHSALPLDSSQTRQPAPARAKPTATLDNLAQFRFYSAWRGVLARRLAGLPDGTRPPS